MRPIHALHVAGDFPNQRLYVELVTHLAERGVAQDVFSAVRSEREATWTPPQAADLRVHTPHLLRPRHRLLFRTKIRTIVRALERTVRVGDLSVTHAHTVYSDGAVAWRLHRRHGVPFIVNVRNVDINAFMRLRPDLARIRNAVLEAAAAVVFLSPAYRRALLRALPAAVAGRVERKARVIPNGVPALWLEPPPPGPVAAGQDPARLLYVGDFSRNKNVERLLAAVAEVRSRRAVTLTLVGSGGDGEAAVRRALAGAAGAWATWRGRMDDPVALRAVYREHDVFVMPSHTESFGLAYIEALSQGLPVLHAVGEGIDGLFPEGTVAEAVDPGSTASVADGILRLLARTQAVRGRCVEEARRFDWNAIADEYAALYRALGASA